MSRLTYIAIGFVIAVVLIGVFFAVKDVVENRKETYELRLKRRMQSVFWEELRKVRPHEIVGLQDALDKYLDSKLTEKEVEHETD